MNCSKTLSALVCWLIAMNLQCTSPMKIFRNNFQSSFAPKKSSRAENKPMFSFVKLSLTMRQRGGADNGLHESLDDDDPMGDGQAFVAGGLFSLVTHRHTHMSYFGFMFSVRAKVAVLITGLRLASTSPKGPFNYFTYTSPQPWWEVREAKEYWSEAGSGKVQLPWRVCEYSPVPLDHEVEVAAGGVASFFVHCPDCAEAVAYRDELDMPEDYGVTDADDQIEITVGAASWSRNPFEDVEDVPRGLAGVVEYHLAPPY